MKYVSGVSGTSVNSQWPCGPGSPCILAPDIAYIIVRHIDVPVLPLPRTHKPICRPFKHRAKNEISHSSCGHEIWHFNDCSPPILKRIEPNVSDVYDIWLYPLQDWWRTVIEMSNFMSTGQMGNFIFRTVKWHCQATDNVSKARLKEVSATTDWIATNCSWDTPLVPVIHGNSQHALYASSCLQ